MFCGTLSYLYCITSQRETIMLARVTWLIHVAMAITHFLLFAAAVAIYLGYAEEGPLDEEENTESVVRHVWIRIITRILSSLMFDLLSWPLLATDTTCLFEFDFYCSFLGAYYIWSFWYSQFGVLISLYQKEMLHSSSRDFSIWGWDYITCIWTGFLWRSAHICACAHLQSQPSVWNSRVHIQQACPCVHAEAWLGLSFFKHTLWHHQWACTGVVIEGLYFNCISLIVWSY